MLSVILSRFELELIIVVLHCFTHHLTPNRHYTHILVIIHHYYIRHPHHLHNNPLQVLDAYPLYLLSCSLIFSPLRAAVRECIIFYAKYNTIIMLCNEASRFIVKMFFILLFCTLAEVLVLSNTTFNSQDDRIEVTTLAYTCIQYTYFLSYLLKKCS